MLVIGQSEYLQIRQHGEQAYPHECCGVLLGVAENGARSVKAVIACVNAAQDRPHDRYSIDPKDIVRVQRESRGQGLEIVGFYHSHPDHSARWSRTDLAEAHWLGCSYVITRVEKGTAEETNSFLLDGTKEEDKRFVEEEIVEISK